MRDGWGLYMCTCRITVDNTCIYKCTFTCTCTYPLKLYLTSLSHHAPHLLIHAVICLAGISDELVDFLCCLQQCITLVDQGNKLLPPAHRTEPANHIGHLLFTQCPSFTFCQGTNIINVRQFQPLLEVQAFLMCDNYFSSRMILIGQPKGILVDIIKINLINSQVLGGGRKREDHWLHALCYIHIHVHVGTMFLSV